MESDFLSALLTPHELDVRPRKIHSAVFLAQKFVGHTLYEFSLCHGHVCSEALDGDLISSLFVETRANKSRDLAGLAFREKFYLQLRSQVQELLGRDDDVLEAAATSYFFGSAGLGDPASRLRWFRSLPVGTLREAKQLVERSNQHSDGEACTQVG